MPKIIVLGAKGHASEVLQVLLQSYTTEDICFFDDVDLTKQTFLNAYPVLSDLGTIAPTTRFCLGVGGIAARKKLATIGIDSGLSWMGVRSTHAIIGAYELELDATADIMDKVQISNSVSIGKGSLINRGVNVHHDVQIGDFCEVAPGAIILGRAIIGDQVLIGAGAIILPDVVIESKAVIGAGAVVTTHVRTGQTVKGIPAQ